MVYLGCLNALVQPTESISTPYTTLIQLILFCTCLSSSWMFKLWCPELRSLNPSKSVGDLHFCSMTIFLYSSSLFVQSISVKPGPLSVCQTVLTTTPFFYTVILFKSMHLAPSIALWHFIFNTSTIPFFCIHAQNLHSNNIAPIHT